MLIIFLNNKPILLIYVLILCGVLIYLINLLSLV